MTQEQEVMIRLECLKLAVTQASFDVAVSEVVANATTFFNFLFGVKPNE